MKILFTGLLTLLLLAGYSQQQRPDKLLPVTKSDSFQEPKSLEANFTADKTHGGAPISVTFTDLSTGNPTSWKWLFGDGDSSLMQNPVHVYQTTGTYTVKLTISDGSNGFALEKKDYIKVTENYSNCDTLHYPLPEPLTYYIIQNKGYVTGNNTYADKAIADHFENLASNQVITGMIFEFSIAKQAAVNNEKIAFNVWNPDDISGLPGSVLVSDTLPLSALINDVANKKLTTIDFAEPVQPGTSYYMGVMLPTFSGDTICLWSTLSGKLPVGTTWILQSFGTWESAQFLWTPQGDPPFIISCAIYPKTCLLEGIGGDESVLHYAVWPNPTQDIITIVNQTGKPGNTKYSIYDAFGKEVQQGSFSETISNAVDVSKLNSGMYIIRLVNSNTFFSTKFIKR
jgi:PKD repeat protein